MSLSDDRWRRADEVFAVALDVPEGERAGFLERQCGGDVALRQLVDRLLAAAATTDDGLEAGAAGRSALWSALGQEVAGEPAGPAGQGVVIDWYRVVRELGRGGMAVVYLAERADGTFDQQVALKLIKGGTDSDQAVKRFSRERQIMALASHPNIARLLDGGATDDGRPYFVMEYVRGQPIDTWCDSRRLSTEERVRLFLRVADAVAYAHRNLVVHRDIKPGNIMVSEDGAVKLLDFGIARYLGEEGDAGVTRTGARVMTPAYASPEQVSGGTVTTASDIYQLGLLLYALLAGQLPYPTGTTEPDELAERIRKQPPRRPSTAVTRASATGTGEPLEPEAVSSRRGTTPAALRRELAGDLDNIVLMALRKEPERRYPSVAQLMDDLERYLDGRPVAACADTLGYRVSKFVTRHKVGTAFAATFLVFLLGFAVTMGIQARRIARQRDRANQEAETANRVSEFLVDLFKVSDPGEARGNDITVREILDEGSRRIGAELQDQPVVRARLMDTMGRVYQNLGLYDVAGELLEDALGLRRAVLGDEHLAVAKSLNHVGWLLEQTGDFAAAEPLYREALSLHRRLLPGPAPELASDLNNLGLLLHRKGNDAEAESLLREALALNRELRGDHPNTADTLSNLGLVLHQSERYDEAGALYRESLDLRRRILGEDHPHVAISLDNLGRLEFDRGNAQAAAPLFREALALRRKVLGDDHPDTSESINNLAAMRFRAGDLDGAAALFREAVEIDRRALGEDHPKFAVSLGNLAFVLVRAGRPRDAEPYLRQALDVQRTARGDDHWMVGMAHGNLGDCLLQQERHAEAEAELLAGYQVTREALGPDHQRTHGALQRLVALYEDWGRADEAVRYRALLPPEDVDDEPQAGS